MANTRDLIEAIDREQSMKIRSIFEELVQQRISDAIREKRTAIMESVVGSRETDEVGSLAESLSEFDDDQLVEFVENGSFEQMSQRDQNLFESAVERVYA